MKFSRYIFFLVCLFFMLLANPVSVEAQTADYTYKIIHRNEDRSEKQVPGLYGYYYEYAEALRNYNTIVKAIKEDLGKTKDFRNQMALSGTVTGEFTFKGANGMGVIFSTEDDELIIIQHDDGNWLTFKKGRTSRGNEYEYKCRKVSDANYEYLVYIGGSQQIENVNIDGELKRKGGNTRSALDLGDGIEHWSYHIELPILKKDADTRIIVLPYAIDCQTEDTVDYLAPGVYEGKKYHELQVKRKGYDYFKNDSLGMDRVIIKHITRYDTLHRPAKQVIKVRRDPKTNRLVYIGDNAVYDTLMVSNDSIIVTKWQEKKSSVGFVDYIENLKHADGKIVIDTVINYKKPNTDKDYRGFLRIFMEDYLHVFHEVQDPGTCLRISPYKFLQMGAATALLELTDEFYENSRERPSESSLDLGMKFGYNTADIIEDSLYYDSMDRLNDAISGIRQLGGRILDPELESFASPDGNDDHNMKLAQRRAVAAKNRISLGGNSPIKTTPNIDTWEHTAEILDDTFHPAEAQYIRDVMAKHNNNKQTAFPEISKYPTYQEIIKPALKSQCRIVFKFKFVTRKKLDAKEAVAAYMKNKHDPTYSNGDYYNMFAELKDQAEQDTLTEIVYNKLVKHEKKYDAPLATYVINRMALLNIRRGKPDSTTLAPLIHENGENMILNYVKTDFTGIRRDYKLNRPEILLNQAVTFYLLQKEERAKFFVDMLVENGFSSPELTKLLNFINFKMLYRIAKENRTAQQQEDFSKALRYVEESGPDNRAVLYTEFKDLGKTELAWPYVFKMRDDNPVKWYLLALLWAERDGKEGHYPLPDDESLKDTTGIDMNLHVLGYPYYMAYFQKCFETDKSFMKYYFNEGNITEEMRKKSHHAYKVSRIPVYDKLIRLRAIADQEEIAKYQEMESSSKDKDEEKDKQQPAENTDDDTKEDTEHAAQ